MSKVGRFNGHHFHRLHIRAFKGDLICLAGLQSSQPQIVLNVELSSFVILDQVIDQCTGDAFVPLAIDNVKWYVGRKNGREGTMGIVVIIFFVVTVIFTAIIVLRFMTVSLEY